MARAGLRPRPLCLGANGSLSAPPPSGSGVGVTEALATDTPCGHGDGGGWHGPHGGAGSALCGRPGPGVVPVGELEQVRLLGSRPSFPPAGARGPCPPALPSSCPDSSLSAPITPQAHPTAPWHHPNLGAFVQGLAPRAPLPGLRRAALSGCGPRETHVDAEAGRGLGAHTPAHGLKTLPEQKPPVSSLYCSK